MRFVFILLLAFYSTTNFSFGQADSSRFMFIEVVKVDSLPAKLLIDNAKKWMTKMKFRELNSISINSFSASHSLVVYQKGVVSQKIHGKVSYKVLIEVKENKYRYTFSDFVFHYLKQDRNYNMVPTGKTKPLTVQKAAGWQNTWEKHKAGTQRHINSLISDLKNNMVLNPAWKKEIQKEEF